MHDIYSGIFVVYKWENIKLPKQHIYKWTCTDQYLGQ